MRLNLISGVVSGQMSTWAQTLMEYLLFANISEKYRQITTAIAGGTIAAIAITREFW